MSTCANIIIKDFDYRPRELIFYRHSDGYPDCTLPTLDVFMQYVADGKIRDNVGQAAGWLILIGADEYFGRMRHQNLAVPDEHRNHNGWKCGAYEPTTYIHRDIAFCYILNLTKRTIHVYEVGIGNVNENQSYKLVQVIEYKKGKTKFKPPNPLPEPEMQDDSGDLEILT